MNRTCMPATQADGMFLRVKNGSSGTLVNGDIVIWDATDDDGISVDTATAVNNVLVAGVMCETVAAGAYGKMQVFGLHTAVKLDGGTTDIADSAVIGTGAVAGYGEAATAVGAVVGVALQAVTTKTTGKVFIKLA